MEEEHEMSSLRARRKKSSVGLSCCFNGNNNSTKQHRRRASFDTVASSSSPINSNPFSSSPRRSPSNWIKSKTNDDIKDKCRSLFSRMSRHRRHSSADFTYDPLSYALNFNDDDQALADDFCAKNFSSRLPLSPPMKTTIMRTFDSSHPPRMPRSLPDVCRKDDQPSTPNSNDELRRGFEALSVRIMRKSNSSKNASSSSSLSWHTNTQRRNKGPEELSSTRLDEVDHELTSPTRIATNNQEILVQLC